MKRLVTLAAFVAVLLVGCVASETGQARTGNTAAEAAASALVVLELSVLLSPLVMILDLLVLIVAGPEGERRA